MSEPNVPSLTNRAPISSVATVIEIGLEPPRALEEGEIVPDFSMSRAL